METSSEFYTALAAAQAEFKPIRRDKTVKVRMKSGGEYTFAYAPLESILAAVLPALNKHGFALVQRVGGEPQFSEDGPPRGEYLETSLYHAHGSLINTIRIIISEPGPQAYGSALTYARRYGVTLLLGVCADEDDDANAAEGNHAQPKENTHKKAKDYANRFVQAFEVGIDQAVIDLNDELKEDEELYRAVWGQLPSQMRRQIKEMVDRSKAA